MTPRAPFLPKKRNIISKHTGTSRLSPSHLVELTLSFLMVPPWPLRSSSSPRTINFPFADTIAPTAPLFARPLPKSHTSINIASTPPQQYQCFIWVSNHHPVLSWGDLTIGWSNSGVCNYGHRRRTNPRRNQMTESLHYTPIHSLSRCKNTFYIYDMDLWSTPSGVWGSTMM